MNFPNFHFNAFDISQPAEAYRQRLHAFSMSVLETQRSGGNLAEARQDLLYGGKIVLPPSALHILTELDIELPIAYEVRNTQNPEQKTYAGVIEFIANEGLCHLPQWMMDRLELRQGEKVDLRGTRLPKGQWVKLQPQSVDFLDIADPKTALEFAINNYSCLTPGDIIDVRYAGKTYMIKIVEVRPEGAPAIWVTDTDLEVEFEAPVGYKEPEPAPLPSMKARISDQVTDFVRSKTHESTFQGTGQSLAGTVVIPGSPSEDLESIEQATIIDRNSTEPPAPLDLPMGTLYFGYQYAEKSEDDKEEQKSSFKGQGQTLL